MPSLTPMITGRSPNTNGTPPKWAKPFTPPELSEGKMGNSIKSSCTVKYSNSLMICLWTTSIEMAWKTERQICGQQPPPRTCAIEPNLTVAPSAQNTRALPGTVNVSSGRHKSDSTVSLYFLAHLATRSTLPKPTTVLQKNTTASSHRRISHTQPIVPVGALQSFTNSYNSFSSLLFN